MRALALRQHAVVQVVHHIETAAAHHGLVLRRVDGIANARLLSAVERGKGADDGEQAYEVVRGLGECGYGRAVGEAVHLHIARECLTDGVEARAAHVARVARLAESGNMHDHERGVDLPQFLIGHAPFVHLATAEAVNQNVGFFEHLVEQLAAAAVAHVHAQRARVAAIHACAPAGQYRIGAACVATLGVFDADHVGAQIAEHRAGEWAGDCLGKVDDLHALQRSEGFVSFLCHECLLVR